MSTPSPLIDLQIACNTAQLPSEADFVQWTASALTAVDYRKATEIAIRIVDHDEGQQLNREYREKDYATNVLSFPSDLPDFLQDELEVLPLGDLVICAPVVVREAAEQEKPLQQHWAHLVIHGVLHLLGYDHIHDADAEIMEALEVKILGQLGIANPYTD